MNNIINYVGIFSGVCTTISFIPQVIKTWKSKSTKDISFLMFTLFTIGVAGWLIFGILLKNFPIIITNFVTLILASLILIAKIKFG